MLYDSCYDNYDRFHVNNLGTSLLAANCVKTTHVDNKMNHDSDDISGLTFDN